jgi:hypothetical protein
MGFALHNLLFNYIPSAKLITKPMNEFSHSNLKLKLLIDETRESSYLFDNFPEEQRENL